MRSGKRSGWRGRDDHAAQDQQQNLVGSAPDAPGCRAGDEDGSQSSTEGRCLNRQVPQGEQQRQGRPERGACARTQDVGGDHGVAEQTLIGGSRDHQGGSDHGRRDDAGQADVEDDIARYEGRVAVAGGLLPQDVDDGAG